MQSYVGCKIIQAEPMDENTHLGVTNRETRPGYKVMYPGGYISWSPKEVFEEAYRLISEKEKAMIG